MCLCRDHFDSLIDGFTQTVQASSPAQIESLAVLYALKSAKKGKQELDIMESDRSDLRRALSLSLAAGHYNWEARRQIMECAELLASMPGMGLAFCLRAANAVADWAARAHRSKVLPASWISFLQPVLWALLYFDAPCLGFTRSHK